MPGRINESRNTSARFYRADLHVHSPLSFDWKNDPRGSYQPNPLLDRISKQDDISEARLAAYYQAIKAAGLDVVAITDHMKWSFGVALSEYAKKQNGSILILPGINVGDAPRK